MHIVRIRVYIMMEKNVVAHFENNIILLAPKRRVGCLVARLHVQGIDL